MRRNQDNSSTAASQQMCPAFCAAAVAPVTRWVPVPEATNGNKNSTYRARTIGPNLPSRFAKYYSAWEMPIIIQRTFSNARRLSAAWSKRQGNIGNHRARSARFPDDRPPPDIPSNSLGRARSRQLTHGSAATARNKVCAVAANLTLIARALRNRQILAQIYRGQRDGWCGAIVQMIATVILEMMKGTMLHPRQSHYGRQGLAARNELIVGHQTQDVVTRDSVGSEFQRRGRQPDG